MDKKYIITTPGTGHSPHRLTNIDDPNDRLSLCSCGGTSDLEGRCDGTHKKKQALGCCCWYCKEPSERVDSVMHQTKCTHCANG